MLQHHPRALWNQGQGWRRWTPPGHRGKSIVSLDINSNYDQKDEENGDEKIMVNTQVLLEASQRRWRQENEGITDLVHRSRCHWQFAQNFKILKIQLKNTDVCIYRDERYLWVFSSLSKKIYRQILESFRQSNKSMIATRESKKNKLKHHFWIK